MRRVNFIVLIFSCFITIVLATNLSVSSLSSYTPIEKKDITVITNESNFTKMMQVLTHKRCMNCHPNDNVPKQGEDSHPHYFGMTRGKVDHGFEATKCNTCHQPVNNKYSGVPGTPHWGLAPSSMGWQGLTNKQIAQSLLDKAKNGNRSYEDLVRHMTEDKLVLWAWKPGVDAEGNPREVPPISKEEFDNAVQQWFKDGAVIPED